MNQPAPLLCAFLSLALPALAAEPVSFSRDVLPILSDNCFGCHGQDESHRKAKLRLDVREAALAKEAFVPGKPDVSALIERIVTTDEDELMPPPKSHKARLTKAQVDLLRRWIAEGAVWGKHWAFEAPVKSAAKGHPVDAFVGQKLAAEGLTRSKPAPKHTLLRRLSFDLTGLPPTEAETAAFLADGSPAAYEQAVDRLLASPHYGERMAMWWLDAARYADTDGFQSDATRTNWPWRDWVVEAFNRNTPYDQFTLEQFAGDLLPNATAEQKLATCFQRNHMTNGEGGRDPEESRVDYVLDRVNTMGTTWLGMTLGCAQCHTHKFDPITQADYYALSAFFNSIDEDGKAGGAAKPFLPYQSKHAARAVAEAQQLVDAVKPAEAAARQEAEAPFTGWLEKSRADAKAGWQTWKVIQAASLETAEAGEAVNKVGPSPREELATLPAGQPIGAKLRERLFGEFLADHAPYQTSRLALERAQRQLGEAKAASGKLNVMVLAERKQPRDTFVLVRGVWDKHGDKVNPDVPQALAGWPTNEPRTRLGLARWLTSKDNPLTARVTVNHLWQMLFGQGLVRTTEDLGLQGERPIHPELLDWLAVDLVEHGWDLKRTLKLIVMSETYRQDSAVTPALLAKDPENKFLARGARFRLPSWMIRDSALRTAGLFNPALGGPPVRPYQPDGVWEELFMGRFKYEPSEGAAQYRRTLYAFWRRSIAPTFLFDSAQRRSCEVRTGRTNTPLQALTLQNDLTYLEASQAIAADVMKEGGDAGRLQKMLRKVLSREGDDREAALLGKTLMEARAYYRAHPAEAAKFLKVGQRNPAGTDQPELAAWTVVASLALNLDEAITRE